MTESEDTVENWLEGFMPFAQVGTFDELQEMKRRHWDQIQHEGQAQLYNQYWKDTYNANVEPSNVRDNPPKEGTEAYDTHDKIEKAEELAVVAEERAEKIAEKKEEFGLIKNVREQQEAFGLDVSSISSLQDSGTLSGEQKKIDELRELFDLEAGEKMSKREFTRIKRGLELENIDKLTPEKIREEVRERDTIISNIGLREQSFARNSALTAEEIATADKVGLLIGGKNTINQIKATFGLKKEKAKFPEDHERALELQRMLREGR